MKDFVMIAHSLKGEAFGPAQQVHGATLAVTAELKVRELSNLDIVVDIGVMRDELRKACAGIDYQNLDAHPAFQKVRSTTERIAEHLHGALSKRLQSHGLSDGTLRVVLDETPVAWVAYERALSP